MSPPTANGVIMTAAGGQVYHPRPARNMLIILAGMALMVTYVETMVVPSFGAFINFFGGAPIATVVWILSAYLLVGVVATPVFGKLGDIYGKKKMLMVAMGVYAVAVSIAGFTPNIGSALGVSTPNQIYLLIGARALQGVGMGMFPLAFAMIPEFFPADRVGQAQGVVSAMFAGGAVIGLVLGGFITQTYGWQLTYHTVIPFAVGLLVLAYYILRESPTVTRESMDAVGISSLGFALAFLMLGLTESTYWGWTNFSAVTVGPIPWGVPQFLILSAALFGVFAYWEERAKFPVIRLKSLKARNILVSNVNGVIAGLMMFVTFTTLTILVELPFAPGYNQDPFWMGIISVPAAASMLALGMPFGRMTSRYGPKPVMLLGFALATVGGLLLTQFANSAFELGTFTTTSSGNVPGLPVLPVPVLLLIAPAFVLVGTVAVLISMSNVIVLSVGARELGVQTGMNQTFRNLGSAIGPVLVSAIIASFVVGSFYGHPTYSVSAFQYCFAVLAAISVLGLVLTAFLRNYLYRADGTRTEASLVGKFPAPVLPADSVVTEASSKGPE